jgi:NADH-quinone oxidoreductase subunit N
MYTLISLAAAAILTLTTEMVNARRFAPIIALFGIIISFLVAFYSFNGVDNQTLHNMIYMDNYAVKFSMVILGIATGIFILAPEFLDTFKVHKAETYALMLFSLAGAVTMVSFGNLSMLFLGVELLSIPMYVLAGSDKDNLLSNEASLKYFLMGAFSSAFMLLGIAFIFGATGSFDMAAIMTYAHFEAAHYSPIFTTGVLLLLVSIFFKVSAAPFHFWAPDVYDGAPTIVTTFMSTIVKIAAFGMLVRLVVLFMPPVQVHFSLIIATVAALTMTIGNISALWQRSFKRILAYSGIAHAGYLLIAVASTGKEVSAALLLYGLSYGLSSLIAFGVLMLVYYKTGSEEVSDFKGLAKRHPFLAAATSLAMLSLAGIPPTVGFFAKYYLFTVAINSGLLWLTIIAIINSLISVFYYFRVIIQMYSYEENNFQEVKYPASYQIVIAIAAFLIIALGFFPMLFPIM